MMMLRKSRMVLMDRPQVYIPRQYEQHIPQSGSQSRGWRLFASLQVAE